MSKPVSALRLCYSMFFHSVFRMNSKFSTFSTIVGIGCWGEDRFFSRWLRVSGRISFLLAAAIGYEGSFLLNFVSLLNLVFNFRPSAIWIWRRRGAWWAFFAHGFPRIAERGLRSLRVRSPLRLPETLLLDAEIGISNRCRRYPVFSHAGAFELLERRLH